MLDSRLGGCVLVFLVAQQVHGQGSPSGAALSVGDRVRVGVASHYRAGHIAAEQGKVAAAGNIVGRDELTFTVLSRDGTETRYPAIRARLVGRLTALEANWLTLDLGDGRQEVLVPRAAIQQLDASRGTRSKAWEGAALGAVMPGVPLGLLGLVFVGLFNFECENDCNPESAKFVGAAVGVAVGAGLGAAVGSRIQVDRWEEVSVGFAVGPRPGKGVAWALSLSF